MHANGPSISYRAFKPGDETGVVDLVRTVFAESVAPGYSPEGVATFGQFIDADVLAKRMAAGNIGLLAEAGSRIVGVVEVRENSHIALLFVDRSHQRRGISRELLRRAIKICLERDGDVRTITVNASPNAYPAYRRLGFRQTADETTVNGIRFVPMALTRHRDHGCWDTFFESAGQGRGAR